MAQADLLGAAVGLFLILLSLVGAYVSVASIDQRSTPPPPPRAVLLRRGR